MSAPSAAKHRGITRPRGMGRATKGSPRRKGADTEVVSASQIERLRRLLSAGDAAIVEAGEAIDDAYQRGGLLELCEQIPIHHRKARTLISIARAVDRGAVTEQKVAAIGWAKAARIIEARVGRAKAREAVAFAQKHSVVSLKRFLADGSRPTLVSKQFNLSPADSDLLEGALLKFGARTQGGRIAGREEALMAIIRRVSRQ